MRRYNSFSALVHAFFNRDLYRDVAHSWGGIGFLHLVLLLLLVNVPFALKLHQTIQPDPAELARHLKDVPEIKLEKGQVSAAVPQPYVVNDDAKPPKPAFVLDTTGQIKSFEDTPAQVLVTRTRVYFRDKHQERNFDLKEFPDFTVNKEKLAGWLQLAARWTGPVYFAFAMFFGLLWGMIAIMFVALFGGLVAPSHSTLSTGGYLRLASVARTPVLLLDGLFSLLWVSIPMWWLVSLAMPFAYMLFAVNAANEVPAKPFDAAAPPPPEAPRPDCFTAPPQA